MRRLCSAPWLCAATLLAAAGCGAKPNPSGRLPGSVSSSPCAAQLDPTSCAADAANACRWLALEYACPAETTCPSGACVPADACSRAQTQAGCDAEPRCAWSMTSRLCPLGQTCASDGFCHERLAGGSGCGCVSPLYCPAGAPCPPMECDCSGEGRGGTCTCSCVECPPGTSCKPCACDCGHDDAGCVEHGTCACACTIFCVQGRACPPPCQCGCASGATVNGSAPGAASAWTCPSCAAGARCEPCTWVEAPGVPPDRCASHTDAAACAQHGGDGCRWYALGLPCRQGETCRLGVCQQAADAGSSCACACPACPAQQSCPPCSCRCADGSGSSCTPPGA